MTALWQGLVPAAVLAVTAGRLGLADGIRWAARRSPAPVPQALNAYRVGRLVTPLVVG